MADQGFVAVAKMEDVPPGGKKCVVVSGESIVLCHSKNQIFAVENLCSHAHEKIEEGRMRSGWIACPVHGARFDLATGAPLNPPALVPIKTYAVRVIDDVIEVSLEAVATA